MTHCFRQIQPAPPTPPRSRRRLRSPSCAPLLFAIAHEILGSATDAEDVLQESYLRWRRVRPETVDHPRQYLAQTVTRQALNHLRAAGRRHGETYVGSWLPEPIETEPALGVRLVGKSEAAVRQRRTAPASASAPAPSLRAGPRPRRSSPASCVHGSATCKASWTFSLRRADLRRRRRVGGAPPRSTAGSGWPGSASASSAGLRDERVNLTRGNAMPTVVSWHGEIPVQAVLFDGAGQVHAIYAVQNPDKLAGLGVRRPLAR